MQIPLGLNSYKYQKQNQKEVIHWDTKDVVNGHVLLMGMSGAGKTYTLRKMVRSMLEQSSPDCRVHVFDVHGDIEMGEGESVVRYSESSTYGINPMVLNADPHEGGVRKRVQSLIKTIKKTSFVLGDKQESVLRNLLMDVYHAKGFDPSNPDSWDALEERVSLDIDAKSFANEDGLVFLDVPFAEKDLAKQHGARWNGDNKCWYVKVEGYEGEITRWAPKGVKLGKSRVYPNFDDLVDYTNNKIKETFLGVGRPAMEALERFHSASTRYNAFLKRSEKGGSFVELTEKELQKKGKEADKVREAVESYLEVSVHAKEVTDLIRYSSFDVLKSVGEKLENIQASGLFKTGKPPFDEQAKIHRHHIKSLLADEQKMFVLFSLERLFERAIQRGVTSEIRDVIILDEASKFFDDDEQNILNILAKESRKFGVSLICASQAPTDFSEGFISSVATKIVLGIDEMYWQSSVKKLRLELDLMKWVKLRERILVQMKTQGANRTEWQSVYIGSTD